MKIYCLSAFHSLDVYKILYTKAKMLYNKLTGRARDPLQDPCETWDRTNDMFNIDTEIFDEMEIEAVGDLRVSTGVHHAVVLNACVFAVIGVVLGAMTVFTSGTVSGALAVASILSSGIALGLVLMANVVKKTRVIIDKQRLDRIIRQRNAYIYRRLVNFAQSEKDDYPY